MRELEEAERRLGLRLPSSVREYYLEHWYDRDKDDDDPPHNRLLDPEELEIDDEYVVFMEENQGVVHWGFRTSDARERDPEIYQRLNTEPQEWNSEEMPFSEFIEEMRDRGETP